MTLLNILISIFYLLSLIHLGWSFMMLGVCHGDVRSAIQARMRFVWSLCVFTIITVVATFVVSVWFATILVLFVAVLMIAHIVEMVRFG